MVRKLCLVVWENDVLQEKKNFWSVIPSTSLVNISKAQTEAEAKKLCNTALWGNKKKELKRKVERFDIFFNGLMVMLLDKFIWELV